MVRDSVYHNATNIEYAHTDSNVLPRSRPHQALQVVLVLVLVLDAVEGDHVKTPQTAILNRKDRLASSPRRLPLK